MNLLQENYYQNLLSDLDVYSRLVSSDVVGIICERLKKVGELNPTSVRQIITMTKEMDIDMRAIKKAIAKRMGMTLKEVDRVFDQAAMDSAELAMALVKDQADIVNMKGIKKLARAAANKCKEMILNLSDTFGFKLGKQNLSIRNAYIAVVNKATLAVQTGALDYDTAIREEVKRLSDAGISVVQWESGYRRRLDSSIRMNVMEGVRQMNQEVLNEAGEKFADGVEISAHDRPAPDHADIQGKQFTKEEYEKLNASLKRPIGTLNCMHIAFPIIYGVTEPSYTDEELRTMKENANKKYIWKGKELNGYECTQKQREYETEIRKAQDREKALRAAGDKEGADREHKRAVDLRKEYKAFSEHVGLKEKLNRTKSTAGQGATKNSAGNNMRVAEYQVKNDDRTLEEWPTVVTSTPRKPDKPTYEYKDATRDWSGNATPNSHMVKDAKRVIQDGEPYVVDGENVLLQYTPHEKAIAELLERTYGGEMYMMPKITGKYKRISTPDFFYRGERYDLKEIEKPNRDAVYNAIHKKMAQADNFVIDYAKSGMSEEEIVRQSEHIFERRHTEFVKRIMITDGKRIIKVIERK